MKILKAKTLNCYCEAYTGARGSLLAQHDMFAKRSYANHAALKQDFPSAEYVGEGRHVFNITGNAFRLVVAINFQARIAVIKWFGTHAEYDKISAKEVGYEDVV